MNELTRKKLEVWLSESQMAALLKLAEEFHLPKATFARRILNYMQRGGYVICKPAVGDSYD